MWNIKLRNEMLLILQDPLKYIPEFRMDYLETFIGGLLFGNTDVYTWNSDYDIQKWFFKKYSATMRVSPIHARFLFFACFGVGKEAIDVYSQFINDTLLLSDYKNTPDLKIIHKIYLMKTIMDNEEIVEPNLSEDKKEVQDFIQSVDVQKTVKQYKGCINHRNIFHNLIQLIEQIIGNRNMINIFICFTNHVLQIHFHYKDDFGQWHNDERNMDDNYEIQLLALHAYVDKALCKQYRTNLHVFSVIKQSDNSIQHSHKEVKDVLENGLTYPIQENSSFDKLYSKWKRERKL